VKILKWGVKKKDLAKFVCKYCECEFLAEDDEYKYESYQLDDVYQWDEVSWYSVTCPCCKKIVKVEKLDIETIIEEIKEPSPHYY